MVVYRVRDESLVDSIVKQVTSFNQILFSESGGSSNRETKSREDVNTSDEQPQRRDYERDFPEIKRADQNSNKQLDYLRDEEPQRPSRIPSKPAPRVPLQPSGRTNIIPMHSLALQGIKKFENFKKKFAEL